MVSPTTNMPIGDQVMSDGSLQDYEPCVRHEDYGCQMSDVSCVLSEPLLEMDLDCDLDPKISLDFALEFHRRISSTPSDDQSSIKSIWGKRRPEPLAFDQGPFPAIHIEEEPKSGSDSDFEDGSFEEDDIALAQESLSEGPFGNFFRLKLESEVSKFEKVPYEVFHIHLTSSLY